MLIKNTTAHFRTCLQLLAASLLLVSCEKVIDLDLKGVAQKYVIEGTISNQEGGCRVTITQTQDFDENNDFPGISGATVEISAEGEQPHGPVLLTETEPGVYQAPDLAGVSGNTYTLRVRIGEETFTASSTLPQQVYMDSIYVTDDNLFGEDWKLANVVVADPAEVKNYYRFTQYVNGRESDEPFIADDELTNGRSTEVKLYLDPDTDEELQIHSGDSLTIKMQCTDAATYKYWFSLDQGAAGSGSPVTPANPVSNMEGGALGYFSAHTVESKSIRVP